MKELTIKDIKQLIDSGNVKKEFIESLRNDERKGVQQLIKSYDNQMQKEIRLEKQFEEISSIERQLFANGFTNIVGIDEAGRGPLAGPVVAAAVILPKDFKLLGLTDSKQLSEKERYKFFEIIKKEAVCFSMAMVDNVEIDQINIFEATKKAMRATLAQLTVNIDHVLIDAVNLDPIPYSSEVIVKGDQKSISIAAASILAKVTRDQFMKEIHKEYPMYQFASNHGYGTKQHVDSLKKYGITPYHRKTFSPVQKAIQ